MPSVRVHRPVPYTADQIGRVIGMPAADPGRVAAPAILLDGRPHHEACRWLEHRHDTLRNQLSVVTNAQRLAGWIRYLRSRAKTVHTADETDYRAYENWRRYHPDPARRCTWSWWSTTKSTIKQFHEHLQRVYGTDLPFALVRKYHREHGEVTGILDAGRRTESRPSVLPLHPPYIDELIRGATRPAADGTERPTGLRDVAIIELFVATGVRLNVSRLLTHYELPPVGDELLGRFYVPAEINKYKRAVLGISFARRLASVHAYVRGDRRLSAATDHNPKRPLRIVDADPDRFVAVNPDGVKISRRWDQATERDRLSLVDLDGTSPLLILSRYGRPLGARAIQHLVSAAARAAHDANPRFPARVWPHALRHTYATLMAAIYVKGVPERHVADPRISEHLRGGYPIVNAVQRVQHQLGHADERTTRLYTQHVHLLLEEPVERLLGGP